MGRSDLGRYNLGGGGGAQTGYLSILSIPWTVFCSQSSSYYSFNCTCRSTTLRSTSSDCKIISGQLDELLPKIYIFSRLTQVVEHVKHFKLISTIFFLVSRAMKSKISFIKSIFCISRELNSFGNLLFANRFPRNNTNWFFHTKRKNAVRFRQPLAGRALRYTPNNGCEGG